MFVNYVIQHCDYNYDPNRKYGVYCTSKRDVSDHWIMYPSESVFLVPGTYEED